MRFSGQFLYFFGYFGAIVGLVFSAEMISMPGSAFAASRILVQKMDSSLHKKVWRLGRQGINAARALIYLKDGGARVETGEEVYALEAPLIFWLNKADGCRLTAEAGTTGYLTEIPEEIVARAVGDFSETATLRSMVDQNQILSLDLLKGNVEDFSSSLATILSEIQAPQSGSAMLIIAHLRIILVAMMRLTGAEEPQQGGAGSSARFLQRFRQLVESNFRAHWPISRYAELIGISHDRLHAICQRELDKTPKALVAERLAREAGLGLERSTVTIEQLSHTLGFRDPAHFSHFFKRMTGTPPGKFRRMMANSSHDSSSVSPANFAEWP